MYYIGLLFLAHPVGAGAGGCSKASFKNGQTHLKIGSKDSPAVRRSPLKYIK